MVASRSRVRRRRRLTRRTTRFLAAAVSVAAAMVAILGSGPAVSAAPSPIGDVLGSWKLSGHYDEAAAFADQGLASVTETTGTTTTIYRGGLSIPIGLRLDGWTHVGDPGGWRGYLFDAYQAGGSAGEKMFAVTTPSGVRHDFVHHLAPGEAPNNSFAAVSPDGMWMVSGEWGRMTRLLVYPTPLINAAASSPSGLPLSATISLDRPVRDVQGCAFVTATELMCASDDPSTDLWPTPRQLLEVTLAQALTGAPLTARVHSLGELPDRGTCTGHYEVEGVDYRPESGLLRVEVTPPGVCALATTIYEYVLAAAASGAA